ncbi:unnamed protein product, partial [Ectocarpus sp. 6 AP-2014]
RVKNLSAQQVRFEFDGLHERIDCTRTTEYCKEYLFTGGPATVLREKFVGCSHTRIHVMPRANSIATKQDKQLFKYVDIRPARKPDLACFRDFSVENFDLSLTR